MMYQHEGSLLLGYKGWIHEDRQCRTRQFVGNVDSQLCLALPGVERAARADMVRASLGHCSFLVLQKQARP